MFPLAFVLRRETISSWDSAVEKDIVIGTMDKVKSLFQKPNPQELLRDWQRKLRQECRNIDRQVRDIEREEKGVQKAIREAAKRNDMGSAKEKESYLKYIENKLRDSNLYVQVVPTRALYRNN